MWGGRQPTRALYQASCSNVSRELALPQEQWRPAQKMYLLQKLPKRQGCGGICTPAPVSHFLRAFAGGRAGCSWSRKASYSRQGSLQAEKVSVGGWSWAAALNGGQRERGVACSSAQAHLLHTFACLHSRGRRSFPKRGVPGQWRVRSQGRSNWLGIWDQWQIHRNSPNYDCLKPLSSVWL